MTAIVSDALLTKFSKFIENSIGLHFEKNRRRDLENKIGYVTKEFGFENAESCIDWLMSSPLTRSQIETLASYLTIGETYFFRENKSFDALENHILKGLIQSLRENGKRLRIWSAGCATGEEPYSIAILLSKMIPDIKDWNITILATDINSRFLQKASDGLYSKWSFRGVPSEIKKRYFKLTKDGHYKILPEIKRLVKFTYLNLAEDTYPSLINDTNAMDIMFCRNVLMYFNLKCQKKVVKKLYHSLIQGGWLAVSPSEASHIIFSQFETVNFPGVILYRKVQHKKNQHKARTEYDFEITVPSPAHQTPVNISFEVQSPVSLQVQTDLTRIPGASRKKQQESVPPPIPESRETPYEKALELFDKGRYAEAAENLAGLTQDDPKAIALLARAYANLGKLNDALEWSEKALDTDKLNPGFHYLRATILQEQGKIDGAMTSLKRALYLEPDFVLAHFAMGNLVRQQGKFKESDRHFSNALSILQNRNQTDLLPESDGITAGRLSEIISCMTERELRI